VIEHVARALLVQTLTLGVASGAVQLLQLVLVRWFGAGAGYLAWLLVPVAMLAVALPHPATDMLVIHVPVAAVMQTWSPVPATAPEVAGDAALAAVVAAWAAGVLLFAAVLVRRQRGFEALVASPSPGRAACLPAGTGPAVLGVWRQRIVLPCDFDIAFDAEERRLMLLHEGVHLRRADNAWNLLASALLVVHWFNPVAWWSWRRMRADQEQSCDAAVLREQPAAASTAYATALLKVQGVALAPPLATAWQSTHPLIERVRMLKVHRISSARHRAGRRAAALLVVVAGIAGYALRAGAGTVPGAVPADKTAVLTSVDVEIDGQRISTVAPQLLTRLGEKATLRRAGDAAKHLLASEIAFTASALPGDRVQIDAELRYGDSLVGSPRLITHDGEPARLEMKADNEGHRFAVTLLPRLVGAEGPSSALVAPAALPAPGRAALPPMSAPSAPSQRAS
jgi:beta-lactamase regulating signal transducer with metallopeptidase domain